ncbi:MAG: Crp/Fnr family transcriptional regulator [Balneolaceae bacterium]|nr:MAG: Crp/Fnr family transcriptional regulator [Balneolaceae bacterium]
MIDTDDRHKPAISVKLIDSLKEHGIIKRLQEGELLFQEEMAIRDIPVILNGSVKIFQVDEDYREILLYYLKPGDTCIMSFLGGLFNDKSKLKAIANEESEILLLPVYKAGLLLKNYPEWTEYIFRVYYQRFKELLDVVNAVAFKKMDERLLTFLKNRSVINKNNEIEITHEELANELGTARVVISRLLKQMEKENLVELGRNRITLL